MESSGEEAEVAGIDRQLPENSAEYLLFVLDDGLDARKTASQLEAIRKAAIKLCRDLAADYVWQRDEFQLEISSHDGESGEENSCP
jgi:hypothetical protein